MNLELWNEQGNEEEDDPELHDPILGHNELFEYDRNLIERGSYSETRKSLKMRMCAAFVNIACGLFLMLYLIFQFPHVSYSSLYLMEKVWFTSWIFTYYIGHVQVFFAAWYAKTYPQLLLNQLWQKRMFKLHIFFWKLQQRIFLCVITVDVNKYWFEWANVKFNQYEQKTVN